MAQAQLDAAASGGGGNGKQLDAFFDEDVAGHGETLDDDDDLDVFSTQMNAQESQQPQFQSTNNGNADSDEEGRQLDISRQPDFYKANDGTVVRIGKSIRMRLFYHPERSSFYVYWMKKNNMELSSVTDHSHMLIHCSLIRNLWQIVQEVCDELDATPWDEIPKSHQNSNSSITDKDSPSYWAETVALWTTDKSIACRSYRNAGSTFMVRLLLKRKFTSKFPTWIGRTMSLNLLDARSFVDALKEYEKILNSADEVRIKLAQKAKAERDKADKENQTAYEAITPPPDGEEWE